MVVQIHQRSVESITDRVATSRRSAQHRHRPTPKKEFQFHRPGNSGSNPDHVVISENPSETVESPESTDEATPADIFFSDAPDQQTPSAVARFPKATSKAISVVVESARQQIRPVLFDYIDTNEAATLTREELELHLAPILVSIMAEKRIGLSGVERRELLDSLIDDMLGYGPLQPLINDPTISEILVNQPDMIFVERKGILERSSVKFQDEAHVRNIAVHRTADFNADRIDQNQLGKARTGCTCQLGGEPATQGDAHHDGIIDIQLIQQIEIEIFQIIHAIEMIRYFGAVKPRMGRGDDLEIFGKFIGKGLVDDRSAATMQQQERRAGSLARDFDLYALKIVCFVLCGHDDASAVLLFNSALLLLFSYHRESGASSRVESFYRNLALA